MPPNERSLAKVAALLGHEALTTVTGWSSRFRWVERATAWDDYHASRALEVRSVGLTEAQEAVMQNWQMFDLVARDLINAALGDMRAEYLQSGKLDTVALNRLVRSAIDLDTTSRRNLGLPTNYKTETVDEPDTGDTEFFIG